MRHVRNPITGLCQVCGKSGLHDHSVQMTSHDGDYESGSRYNNRSRSPERGNTGNRAASPHRDGIFYVDSPSRPRPASVLSTDSDLMSAPSSELMFSPSPSSKTSVYNRSPSPDSIHHVYHSTSRLQSPAVSTRRVVVRRSVSPGGRRRTASTSSSGCCDSCCLANNSMTSSRTGCCGRTCCRKSKVAATRRTSVSRRGRYDDYDEEYGTDRCCGYSDYETASYGAGTWAPRRCCALLVAIGVLLGLAGLAVGLYFGITAALAEQQRKQSVSSYIASDKVSYVIYGADQKCNPYNNGTATSVVPNCNAITTIIAVATNKFVAPTDPAWAAGSSRASTLHRLHRGFVLSIVCCGLQRLLWCDN